MSSTSAGLGASVLRDASLGLAGPNVRAIPGFGALVAFAILGGFALPAARRTSQRIHTVEQRLRGAARRVRRERIMRYAAARDSARASAAE